MVDAVDSREEQTEWKNADNEAQYMRMWDEVGITPRLHDSGPWAGKLGPQGTVEWKVDSEFAPGQIEHRTKPKGNSVVPVSAATPNIHAMSDKQFEAYLEKLRQSRPAFASYLKEKPQTSEKENAYTEFQSFWEYSRKPSSEHKNFLGSQAYKLYNSPGSRAVEQQPQTYGGLQYSKQSPLQSQLYNKPRPGRFIVEQRAGNGPWWGVVFAGNHATAADNSAVPTDHLDFKRLAQPGAHDPNAGVANFRLTNVTLYYPPQTVGQPPQPLRATSLETTVKVEKEVDMERSNAHRPGSREYVGHSSLKIKADTILSPVRKSPLMPLGRAPQPVQSADVLDTLRNIVSKRS